MRNLKKFTNQDTLNIWQDSDTFIKPNVVLLDKTIYFNIDGHILPYDAEIEYLESTGTQYINTGIIANPGEISFEVDCTIENESGSSVYTVGGLHYIYQSSDNGIRTGGTNNAIAYTPGNRITITASYDNQNRRTVTIGDTVIAGTAYDAESGEFVLLRIPKEPNCIGKLYSAKVYLNSILVRDMIPVRIGQVGYMYDKVSKELFDNNGEGNFILGQDIIEVEYLEATGTQYINTDLSIYNVGLSGEIKIQRTGNSTADNAYIGRSMQSGFELYTSSSHGICLWVSKQTSDTYLNTGASYFDKNIHTITFDITDTKSYLTVDGEQYSEDCIAYVNNSAYVQLFSHRGYYNAEGRIYYCKLYYNSILSLDLIPVRVGQTGYMFDKVHRKLFGNKGTGDLLLGPDKININENAIFKEI